jgi:hypothetical protein
LELEYEDIQKRFVNAIDRAEKNQLRIDATEIEKKRDRLIRERANTMRMFSEYKFMKDVKTLEKFKEKIRECNFWADTWAI